MLWMCFHLQEGTAGQIKHEWTCFLSNYTYRLVVQVTFGHYFLLAVHYASVWDPKSERERESLLFIEKNSAN